jgi:SnoaL-like domain
MSTHVSISPTEASDRLAIRELVEAYAHCADRRDAKGQMSLFTADTHFVVYMNQGPDAVTGAAVARGTCSDLCRPEQVRRHDALHGAEHHSELDE